MLLPELAGVLGNATADFRSITGNESYNLAAYSARSRCPIFHLPVTRIPYMVSPMENAVYKLTQLFLRVSAILKRHSILNLKREGGASGELRKVAMIWRKRKSNCSSDRGSNQSVEAAPRTRITGSAAFHTVKAATERLVQICVVAAGVLRVAILVTLTSGHFRPWKRNHMAFP
jgi:hypothetical protein